MQTGNPAIVRRCWAVALFVLIGTLAGIWHNRQERLGRSDATVSAARALVAPPANALGHVSRWISVETGWLFHGRTTAQENRDLHRRVEALTLENASLRESAAKYEALRRDQGFVARSEGKLLAADVIARRPDPKFDTLIVSCGSSSGVKPNSVVVTPFGLVGRVTEVTPNTATVIMLTDQNSGVGARIQRAGSRATGVVKGDNTPHLNLVYLPKEAGARPGDLVVTSGLGGIYPAGIVIGTIVKVTPDEGNILKSAVLKSSVDFDRLEEVYLRR